MPARVFAILAVGAVIAIVESPVAAARARPSLRACGQTMTRILHAGSVKIFDVDQVSARRVSCARARAFDRHWEWLADHGGLPAAADGKARNGVLVFNRWGPPYRIGGFVCRTVAVMGPGPVQPARTTCGGPAGLITWHESGRYG